MVFIPESGIMEKLSDFQAQPQMASFVPSGRVVRQGHYIFGSSFMMQKTVYEEKARHHCSKCCW